MCWVEGTQVWLFVKKSQGRYSMIVVDLVVMLSGEFVTCHFCLPSDSREDQVCFSSISTLALPLTKDHKKRRSSESRGYRECLDIEMDFS